MDDQAEQFSSYDGPVAESEGARVTRMVQESTAKRDREGTLLRIIQRLLTMLDTGGVSLDVNITDNGPMATVDREGTHYDVRQNKRGTGS